MANQDDPTNANADQATVPPATNAGRVVAVTGAASGIGRACVDRLVGEGAQVIAVDLDDGALAWARGLDGVLTLAGSVSEPETNEAMVEIAMEAHGRLDAVALNAGILVQGDIVRGSMDDFDRVMDVNVRAVALGLKAGLAVMEAGASIVVTASVSGLGGDTGVFAYNTAKGAVVNLTRAAALDVAHLGIRVNAVCPGPISTAMTEDTRKRTIGQAMAARVPMGRFGQPDEVAAAISFLASPASSFINGVALPVDGGVTAGTGQWAGPATRAAGFA